MVDFKGTKGKWRIGDDFNQVTISKPGILVGSEKICAISDFGKTKDEKEANAKLIAAAPELLEALIEIVRISDRKHDAWDKAKKAIKKATE